MKMVIVTVTDHFIKFLLNLYFVKGPLPGAGE